MSVTFYPMIDGARPTGRETTTAECCLCAQMAPCFHAGAVTDDQRSELAEYARHDCLRCHGSGVEMVTTDDVPSLNLAQPRASALLCHVLDLAPGERPDLASGCVSIEVFRAALDGPITLAAQMAFDVTTGELVGSLVGDDSGARVITGNATAQGALVRAREFLSRVGHFATSVGWY